MHIEYKNLLARSFNPLIIHIYFIQKDKSEFVEILIGHIVVLDLPCGFHDSFHQQANIHNRDVLLVLGADKK